MKKGPHIGIIGAGISGLSCAARLNQAGMTVTLVDKARGPGGRISTRRDGQRRFDHGAQYFTARSESFQQTVESWRLAGAVAPWTGRFATWAAGVFTHDEPRSTRWVGAPRMSALPRYLAKDLDVRTAERITALVREPQGWVLHNDSGDASEPFDVVLLSCPGPQAAALLPADSMLHQRASSLSYRACWAVMAHYEATVPIGFDGVRLTGSPLSWVARDSSKPGRDCGERWVLHASSEWSEANLEADPQWVCATLAEAFAELGAPTPSDAKAHRWRYALSELGRHSAAYFEPGWGLGLCGDGLARPRVEDAWRSGATLAELVKAGVG